MKSDKEWHDQLGAEPSGKHFCYASRDDIRAIQADALRRAAEIADVTGCIKCQDTYLNIIAEVNRLEKGA